MAALLLLVVSASIGQSAESGPANNQAVAVEAVTAAPISERVLWSFGASTDGVAPFAGLIFDLRGNLYGTTAEGGTNGVGTVFELSPPHGQTQWRERALWNFVDFPADGAVPVAGLIFDLRGHLYGTTVGGGTNNAGTIFQLSGPRG